MRVLFSARSQAEKAFGAETCRIHRHCGKQDDVLAGKTKTRENVVNSEARPARILLAEDDTDQSKGRPENAHDKSAIAPIQ